MKPVFVCPWYSLFSLAPLLKTTLSCSYGGLNIAYSLFKTTQYALRLLEVGLIGETILYWYTSVESKSLQSLTYYTCRHFAKKTIMKTAKKAGIKTKQGTRQKTKYILPPPTIGNRSMTPRSSDSESEGGRPGSELFDDLSSKWIFHVFCDLNNDMIDILVVI